jgi:hypothetical protein
MSNIVDKVFSEVCLDERVSDGIFKMEEEQHMNALRDYFVKRGITKEVAVNVTNRMVEGKHPDRQAWRKEDGILVTWPTPKHKKEAMAKEPGKYVEQDPSPKKELPQPVEKPTAPSSGPVEEPTTDDKVDDGEGKEPTAPNIFQGQDQLAVEPDRGAAKPEPTPAPPVQPATPRTPQTVAAEREVIQQILSTDDTTLSNIEPKVGISEQCKHQLNELYKKAEEWGLYEASAIIKKYIK